MSDRDSLTRFVREALGAGKSREEIGAALAQAGWSEREIAGALDAFAAVDFSPPVPRPSPQLTARDAFTYLVLFSALAFAAANLVTLVHAILDLSLRAPGDEAFVAQRAIRNVRWASAVLVVATPVYAWMTIMTRRQIAEDAGRRRSLVRKWLTYLALFVAALVFFGDAVAVIYWFLQGEATLRFLLKALTVACVAGAVFLVYLRDAEADGDER